MACQTPVVTSAVGGIPEIVDHGVSGLLVPFDPVSADVSRPARPQEFVRDLAGAINTLVEDSPRARPLAHALSSRVAIGVALLAAAAVLLFAGAKPVAEHAAGAGPPSRSHRGGGRGAARGSRARRLMTPVTAARDRPRGYTGGARSKPRPTSADDATMTPITVPA
jgi:hypothetical protein